MIGRGAQLVFGVRLRHLAGAAGEWLDPSLRWVTLVVAVAGFPGLTGGGGVPVAGRRGQPFPGLVMSGHRLVPPGPVPESRVKQGSHTNQGTSGSSFEVVGDAD